MKRELDFDSVRAALGNPDTARPRSRWFERLGIEVKLLTPAAVLIGLRDGPAGLEVILTRRMPHLKHHAGQISFPGGRIDADDASVEDAALREAEEEIGLNRHCVTTVGRLAELPTITGYVVTPVIGLVSPGQELIANPDEVAEVFCVPLAFLLDENNIARTRRLIGAVKVPMFQFEYQDKVIWGATANMIMSFRSLLIN